MIGTTTRHTPCTGSTSVGIASHPGSMSLASGQPAPPHDNWLLSTIIPQSLTTDHGLAIYHDTEDLTAATTQNDLLIPIRRAYHLGVWP